MKLFDHTTGTHLDINGTKIYYDITGEDGGQPILLLHGGFGNMEDFNIILESLSNYKIIAIDSRGQGKSELGTEPLTYEHLQNDVLRIVEYLGITNLSIIGFSDGGIVAYRLAALKLLKINKLVTIGARWNISDALLTKQMFLETSAADWQKKMPWAYDRYQQLNPKPDFELLTSVLVKMWLDPNPTGYLNEKVDAINVSLLIVHGDDDEIMTNKSVCQLAENIEGAHLLNIPFATHAAFQEQPKIFTACLQQFLAG